MPLNVVLEVTLTDPGFKGDTATGGNKPAQLETGLTINVPLFVNTGDKIRVDIADSGMGIEPDVLPKVFQRFEQGGSDVTRQFGGLGLGLSIAQAIIEKHRGVIRAVYAAAAGWDLLGKPPTKLAWDAVHLFRLGADGAPAIEALNLR